MLEFCRCCRQMRRIKVDRDEALAISDHCVARIEAHDHSPRRIEFQHHSRIYRQVRAPSDASIGNAESKAGVQTRARFVKENITDAEKAGARFGEHAKLFEALSQLHAELPLKRAALAKELKDILIWKEV